MLYLGTQSEIWEITSNLDSTDSKSFVSIMPLDVSVLIIGAGGTFGKPLVEEFIRQKFSFLTIGILASSASRAESFKNASDQGVKIVFGSFLAPESYAGIPTTSSSETVKRY